MGDLAVTTESDAEGKCAVSGDATVYTHDTSGRLSKAAVSDASDYTYGYNARGNRTSAPNQSLSFNAANQISSSGHSYDVARNIKNDPSSGVTGTTYTPADQLVSVVKGGTTYTYRHAGVDNRELVSETTTDGTYEAANRYAYAGNDPTNFTDPLGQFCLKPTLQGATAGAVGGAIAGSFVAGVGAAPWGR